MEEHKEHEHHAHEHKEHVSHTHEKKEHHSPKKGMKLKKLQIWQISSGILGLLLLISIFTNGFGPGCAGGATMAAQAAADKAVDFLNNNVLQGQTATVNAVEDIGSLYNIKLEVAGREYDSYVTKDGSLLFPSGISMEETPEQAAPATSTQDFPKTAKPKVDLFIMSYCPYGIQAQQGMYPVAELLGESIEFNVKWVPYIMHGMEEIEENNRQYCIQKEQPTKYVDYMGCFIGSQDATACGTEAGIDEAKISACIVAADEEFHITENYDDKASWLSGRFPIYEVDKEEADALGVRGSPTMFINGVQYGGARTPEAYKAAICNAFEDAPEDCDEVLSSEAAAASGSCG
jgi:protein-disulfide isomerase